MIFVLQPLLPVTIGAQVHEQEVLRRKYRVILTKNCARYSDNRIQTLTLQNYVKTIRTNTHSVTAFVSLFKTQL